MTRSYASLLTWLGLTIAASVMLYHTSDRVNALSQQLRAINTQIESEQASMHVLKAEWVYLANPARIEAEAQRHLDLRPTATQRVAALQDIGDLLPLRDGIEPMPRVMTAQAAPPMPVKKIAAAAPAAPAPHSRIEQVIAALNAGRLNDHMNLQHTVAEPPTDRIGALIGTLGLHP